VLAAMLFGLVLMASRWILRRALEPVSQMTLAAADWSEHNPDRRFARGEPYDELSSLAATLDTLLTRLGNSLRNEQRFSSEMSHELRTPLARIHAEVELALEKLRPELQQPIRIAYFEECTYQQVAARLNLPEGTVKSRIRTGFAQLRILLEQYSPQPVSA